MRNWWHGARQKAESFPVFMAEEYLGQVEPNCKNCTLAPLDKRNAQFRGHRVPFSDPQAGTFRIGDWSPQPATRISAWSVSLAPSTPQCCATSWFLSARAATPRATRISRRCFAYAERTARASALAEPSCTRPQLKRCSTVDAIGEVLPWQRWTINFLVLLGATWAFTRLDLRMAFPFDFILMIGIYVAAQTTFTIFHLWFPFLETLLGVSSALPCGVAWQYVKANLLRSETEKQRAQLMSAVFEVRRPAGGQRHLGPAR